jgi:O-antigen/teichoic acid export membrane protein
VVRRFFRDSAIYVLPAAVSSGMSFFLFPFYAHRFTPREYGAFDLLMLVGVVVGWTVALEIYQGVGRYVAGEKDQTRSRSYASTALWFSIGAYGAFAAVAELFASPISHLLLGAGISVSLFRVAVPGVRSRRRESLHLPARSAGQERSEVSALVARCFLVSQSTPDHRMPRRIR